MSLGSPLCNNMLDYLLIIQWVIFSRYRNLLLINIWLWCHEFNASFIFNKFYLLRETFVQSKIMKENKTIKVLINLRFSSILKYFGVSKNRNTDYLTEAIVKAIVMVECNLIKKKWIGLVCHWLFLPLWI